MVKNSFLVYFAEQNGDLNKDSSRAENGIIPVTPLEVLYQGIDERVALKTARERSLGYVVEVLGTERMDWGSNPIHMSQRIFAGGEEVADRRVAIPLYGDHLGQVIESLTRLQEGNRSSE